MHTHTVKAFDEEIGDLRALIAQMGGMAEEAIRAAVVALRRHDLAGAAAIVAGDKAIDALEMEVEQLAMLPDRAYQGMHDVTRTLRQHHGTELVR